ncbi:MAG: hypothetical protein U9R74_19695 [Pseudomonadota bacterium]|nr:hypothetical protein [Pseudomonadota bacterium]
MLTFIIPVIAEEISDNRDLVLANLRKTLASVKNQTSPDWRALIVSQSRPKVDYVEDKIVYVHADFPPARKYAKNARLSAVKRAVCRRANDLDRVRKIRVAAQALHRFRTDFVMLLEADDLVSNHLCEFVEKNRDANGWSIDKGYVWNGKTRYLLRTDKLTSLSGSSWVVKVFYEMLPETIPLEVEPSTLSLVPSGCPFLDNGHRMMKAGMARAGKPLDVLPFHGVIYHSGHGANLSRRHPRPHSSFVRKLLTWQRDVIFDRERARNRVFLGEKLRSEFAIGRDPDPVTTSEHIWPAVIAR